jgi:hypothetical protein
MAIQKDLTNTKLARGVPLTEAYLRIERIDIVEDTCDVVYAIYYNKAVSDANKAFERASQKTEPIVRERMSFAYPKATTSNAFKVAYNAIKELDEFKDGIDV